MERLFALPVPDAERLAEILAREGVDPDERWVSVAELVDADLWIAGSGDLGPSDAAHHPLELRHGGSAELSAEQLELAIETNRHADAPKLGERVLERSRHATRVRADLVPDFLWYLSPIYRKHRKPAGLDDFALSLARRGTEAEPAGVELLSFHRLDGKPGFGPRERAIVHIASMVCIAPEGDALLWPWLAAGKNGEELVEATGQSTGEIDSRLRATRELLGLADDVDWTAHLLRGGGTPG